MKTTALISLFRKSLRGSFSGKLWKWLLSGVGSLCALLLLGKNFLGATVEASVWIGLQLIFGVYLTRFVLNYFTNLVVLLHYRFRESLYGDAIVLLKDAFAQVHYLRKQEKWNEDLFMESMRTICNKVKIIFDRKTKADCSVSIKVPIGGHGPVSPNTILTNLCRDSAHFARDNEKYNMAVHTVIGNTAYSVVLSNVTTAGKKKLYYLNNNVPDTPNYLTTSPCPENKLYYESELVYPIVPVLPEKHENSSYKPDIWGFLCIVCSKSEKIDDRYDVAIAEGVCDGIFDLIVNKNKLQ